MHLNKQFQIRREQLLKSLESASVVIIFATEKPGSGQSFHQNSDFYYLTGFIEPDAIAVIIPAGRMGHNLILFSHARNPEEEVWNGKYFGQRAACKYFGAAKAYPITETDKVLPEILKNYKNIYSNKIWHGQKIRFHQKIIALRAKLRTKLPVNSCYRLLNLNELLHEQRLIKDSFEIKNMRKAAEATAAGFLRAMQDSIPDRYEFELEADLLYEFTRRGCQQAFSSIVAGGKNACTLHYSKNNRKVKTHELVLIDAGAKYEHYCSDLSRTFPINGKFTDKQREIYKIVLAAQLAVIKQICPGVTWETLQQTAERVLTIGLVDAKMLHGKLETLLSEKKFKPFFMHKVGHWIGLDIHDVGKYQNKGKWRAFEPGMVITIEPGLYIKKLNIGIRIEDTVLVTKNGCEVLTNGVPKSVSEIEKIMKK